MVLSKKEKERVFGIITLLMIFAGVFFISGVNYAEYQASKNPVELDVSLYRMDSQYLGEIDGVSDQGHTEYLIMNCSHTLQQGSGDFQLYFENEYKLREDLNDGDLIQVIWAYQNGMKYIRGVESLS